MSIPVKIYNQQMQLVAVLDNAFAVGYEMPLNNLWRASFSLPADDPKNAECRPLYYVEIFDGDERIDLFRIVPHAAQRDSSGQTITYQCEHVLATLLDDVMFQFHQIGNLGVYTRDVLEYILDKQLTPRWQLGTVSFARQFEYSWENENLLAALFSVPKPFVEEYMWTWDTSVYPWTLNLVEQPAIENDPNVTYIRYGHNMREIEREIDPTTLCTRLYCLGFGEGVNQLTIAEVNGGVPYLDADTQAQYGIISKIWVDRRFEHPETLKARGEALLEELKHPRITYRAKAADLGLQRFRTGSHVIVKDEELGIDITARVVNVRKPDITGAPGDIEIEIANRPLDIAGSIAELADRQRINEVYAQGATNFDSHDFADNCDPDHPAIMRFWVPEETVRINKVRLSFRVEPFRSYERAIEAAPATTSGPSTRQTTAAGGQTTSGPSSRTTTAAGGQTTSGPSSRTTTAAGGQTTSGPSSKTTTEQTSTYNTTYYGGLYPQQNYDPDYTTSTVGDHNHGIPPGTQLAVAGGGYVVWSPSGAHNHMLGYHYHEFWGEPHVHGMDHTHEIAPHVHEMDHTHEIAPHVHEMDHTHEIAPHVHDMDHTHTIPAHTHDIEYGIFEGPTPTAVTVRVDGNVVPGLGTSADEVDIIPYLAKDSGGKIQRGTWHTIEIAPNSLGRIVATVLTQIFVQSRGGGNY
jgi:phage minor structural protein